METRIMVTSIGVTRSRHYEPKEEKDEDATRRDNTMHVCMSENLSSPFPRVKIFSLFSLSFT